MSLIETVQTVIRSLSAARAAAKTLGLRSPQHLDGNMYKVFLPGRWSPDITLRLEDALDAQSALAEEQRQTAKMDTDYLDGLYQFQDVYARELIQQLAAEQGASIVRTMENGEETWILEGGMSL